MIGSLVAYRTQALGGDRSLCLDDLLFPLLEPTDGSVRTWLAAEFSLAQVPTG